MNGKRRRFMAEFKKRVALDALRGERTEQALAAKHEVHPNRVGLWKKQAVGGRGACRGIRGGSEGGRGRGAGEGAAREGRERASSRVDDGVGFFSVRVGALSRAVAFDLTYPLA